MQNDTPEVADVIPTVRIAFVGAGLDRATRGQAPPSITKISSAKKQVGAPDVVFTSGFSTHFSVFYFNAL